MEQLPSLEKASFDLQPFNSMIFEVWPQSDEARMGEPILRVQPDVTHRYSGVCELLRKHQTCLAALLTARIPGRLDSIDLNQKANAHLLEELKASGLAVYSARGTAMSGDWFEDGLVVVGGNYEQYVSWQKLFGQLAFVVFRSDGAAELRW